MLPLLPEVGYLAEGLGRRPVPPYPRCMVLYERAHLIDSLTALLEDAEAGHGRLALVHGEIGIGKSALAREFSDVASRRANVLWGACDPLSSPRPLGPLADLAPHLNPVVGELLRTGERDGLFEATLTSVSDLGPVVVVIEDIHWADASTLDLIRYVARRVDGVRLLMIATYRDDQLSPTDPLRVMLGDLASMSTVGRMAVPPLSLDAVTALAAATPLDPAALFRETGGNPFFVTEVISSGGEHLPATVQDAVLARVHRVSPQARSALEAAAVIGSRVEPSVILAMPGVTADAVDECVSVGMLRFNAPAYGFRHELVRQAVLAGIAPGRLGALHWQALDRLRAQQILPPPLARLADHAEQSGDGLAVLEFATAAGDSAVGLMSHREATFQYGRALRFADLLDRDARIDLLIKRSYESYLIDALADSIAALEQAVVLLRETTRGDELAQALLRLSRVHWTAGHSSLSDDLREEALALLEALAPGTTLARAYAAKASSHMVANEYDAGIEWGERALVLSRELRAHDVEVHVLNTLGVCRWGTDPTSGEGMLLESLALGRELDLEDDVARAYANLVGQALAHLDVPKGLAYSDEGVAYCIDHDLHGTLLCILAGKLAALSRIGEWAEATRLARNLLDERAISRVSRAEPLMALGLIRARRGDPEVWPALDEAELCVREAYELQFQAPVALSRAEAHWLEDNVDAAEATLLPSLEVARRTADHFFLGDLEVMLWRLGRLATKPQTQSAVHRLVLTGEHREAAAYWAERGYCYDAAMALADSDDEADLRSAIAELDRLGAQVLVARTAAKLRSLGVQSIPRGVRASTRANVGGLTDRETQVLDLLDQGLRNAEIAQRLHLSEKTVGHHVSSILAKLGVASRGDAVLRARELIATS